MQNITGKDIQEKTSTNKYVFLDFSASWCGPCKMMEPILESLSKDLSDIKFYKIDIDQNPDAASSYGVTGVPTMLLFKDGKIIGKQVGTVPKQALKKALSGIVNA